MKRFVLVGALVSALGAGAYAQGAGSHDAATKPAGKGGAASAQGAGHTAPTTQPPTEAAPSAPEGQLQLGTVHIPKGVKADGKPLPAGTYQVRLTADTASQEARGQTKSGRA